MWLLTTVGFFSVVRKTGDTELTVRSRVRSDLEKLRDEYLPSLGPITTGEGTDYPYRARVPEDQLGEAISRMVAGISYSNFKNAVAAQQSYERAHVYDEVWHTLRQLTPEDEYEQ